MDLGRDSVAVHPATAQTGKSTHSNEAQRPLTKLGDDDDSNGQPSTPAADDAQFTEAHRLSDLTSLTATKDSQNILLNSGETTSEVLAGGDPGQAVPGANLRFFIREIPDALQDRYSELRVLFTQPLLEAITKKRRKSGDIAMKLRYLGRTEASAQLHIVIQCSKKICKTVATFFAQPHIQEELRPDFRVLVLEQELRLLVDDAAVHVFADPAPTKTWCGLPITMARHGGHTVSATLGGVIIVEDNDGGATLYGLAASHMLSKLTEASSIATGAPYNDSDTDSESSEEDLNITGLGSVAFHTSIKVKVNSASIRSIGVVRYHSFNSPVRANLDWALIGIDSTKALPNIVHLETGSMSSKTLSLHQSIPRWRRGFFKDHDSTRLISPAGGILHRHASSLVTVISSHGLQTATLTFNTSSVLIAPGKGFVHTHDLQVSPDMRLQKGDSGSWVIDQATGEVYGYIVSIDAFGEAQVMPLESVLADIKTSLGAARVRLPDPKDITDMRQCQVGKSNSKEPPLTLFPRQSHASTQIADKSSTRESVAEESEQIQLRPEESLKSDQDHYGDLATRLEGMLSTWSDQLQASHREIRESREQREALQVDLGKLVAQLSVNCDKLDKATHEIRTLKNQIQNLQHEYANDRDSLWRELREIGKSGQVEYAAI